jgi:hypothetical protein
MANFQISLGLSKMTYTALAAFAQSIHNGFIAMVAIFATPNPVMLVFQADIDTLNDRITAWSSMATRTRTDLNNLRAAVNKVRTDLRMLADYAQNTKPNDPDIWEAVGFELKSLPSAPQPLQVVQDLHLFISRVLPSTDIKLKWKRPLGADRSDVKVYVIQKNNVPVQPLIDGSHGIVNNVAGITTDTSIIFEPPYEGVNYFWVTAYNAAGYGVSSDVLLFNAPAKLV